MSVREVLALTRQHRISGLPVVEGKRVVGIVTNRDLRFETNLDQPAANIMTKGDKLVTVPEGTDLEHAKVLMHQHRLERVLVVNDRMELRGLITVKDILKSTEYPHASKDELGRLRVGAAVGTSGDTDERVNGLVAAGVDVLVVDTSHGDSQGVLDRVQRIKKRHAKLQVIGGNIATAEGAKALADSFTIRRTALLYKIPYYTTIAGALAVTKAIQAMRAGILEVQPLQKYIV